MARILSMSFGKNSIDCVLSGSIGNEVWVNRNGKNYRRSKPSRVSNPKSQSQLDHRARFTTMIRFLQPLTLFLRLGFKSVAMEMSPFNAAMSCNLKMAITGAYPDYVIDYPKAMVSRGSLPGALNPQAVSGSTAEIAFSWDDNSSKIGARGDDKALLVVYNPVKQMAAWVIGGGHTRTGGNQTIILPSDFSGDEVHCYMAFQNASQTRVSDSQHVGSLVL